MKFKLNKFNEIVDGMKARVVAVRPQFEKMVQNLKDNPKYLLAGGIVAVGMIGGGIIFSIVDKDTDYSVPTTSSITSSSMASLGVSIAEEVEEEEAITSDLSVSIPEVPREEWPVFVTFDIVRSDGEVALNTYHRDPEVTNKEDNLIYGRNIQTGEMVLLMRDMSRKGGDTFVDALGYERFGVNDIEPIINTNIVNVLLSGQLDEYSDVGVALDPDRAYETEQRTYDISIERLYDYADDLSAKLGLAPVVRYAIPEENKVLTK